jgi:hypothetical protein
MLDKLVSRPLSRRGMRRAWLTVADISRMTEPDRSFIESTTAGSSGRRALHRMAAVIACIWLIQIAEVARSDQQPTAAARETARALMQEGDQLSAAGKHADALKNYLAAHALVRIPPTGLEVARTQAKLGQLVEARGLAMEMANSATLPGEPPIYARARSAAADLARELAPRIPSVRTIVSPAEARYTLTIDNQTIPHEAHTIAFRLNPGPHTIVVAAPGFITQRKEITLPERQAAVINIQLTPAPTKPTTPGTATTPRK